MIAAAWGGLITSAIRGTARPPVAPPKPDLEMPAISTPRPARR